MVAILDKRARKVLQHHDDVLMHQKFYQKVEIALLRDIYFTLPKVYAISCPPLDHEIAGFGGLF